MNKKQAIENFIQKTHEIYDVEYGDFKRKISLYLKRLDEGLQTTDPEILHIIEEIKNQIIYNPKPNLKEAKRYTIFKAEELLTKIH